MDLVSDQRDPNGLLLNPRWQYQVTSVDPYSDYPDVPLLCDLSDYHLANCTSQRVTADTTPNMYMNAACNWSISGSFTSGLFKGHRNWFPVAVTGPIVLVAGYGETWDDQHSIGWDADMDFAIRPPQGRGLTTANFGEGHDGRMEPEWDGYEVFAGWSTTPWWDTLFKYRDTGRLKALAAIASLDTSIVVYAPGLYVAAVTELKDFPDPEKAFRIVNPEHPYPPKRRDNSVVIGEMGLDCRHFCHAELHPTYAMAIHTQANRTDDQWAVFARNWGDEGSCGNDQVPTFMQSFSMRLGHPYAAKVVINRSEFVGRSGIYDEGTRPLLAPMVGWNLSSTVADPGTPEAAAILTMTLPPFPFRPVLLGELSLTWIETLSPAAAAAARAAAESLALSPAAAAAARAAAESVTLHKVPTAVPGGPSPVTRDTTREAVVKDDQQIEALVRQMTPAQFEVFRRYAPRPKPHIPQRAVPVARSPHLTPVRVEDFKKVVQSIPDTVHERRARQLVHAICMAYDGKPPGSPAVCDSLK